MDIFLNVIEVILRALFSVIILFFMAKLMGTKQISQLTFFDYIIGISIGSIAAQMACDRETPFWDTGIAMVVYSLIALSISIVTNKSMRLRRFFTGTPTVLLDKGKIIEGNLSKVKLDVNDLLSLCRKAGYFNISDVEYAIMETNGQLSVMPKVQKRPVVCEDLNILAAQEEVLADVIIDGKLMRNNLKAIGKEEKWLRNQLNLQKANRMEDILLATVDTKGNLSIYYKGEQTVDGHVID